MKMTRRDFSKVALAGLAGTASLQGSTVLAQSSAKPSPTADAPKPTFKPVGVERSKVLKILSGRNRPDLTPVYKMWEQLTGMRVDLEKISHLDAMDKLIHQKNDPQYDLMVTNTMAEPEIARPAGISSRTAPRSRRNTPNGCARRTTVGWPSPRGRAPRW